MFLLSKPNSKIFTLEVEILKVLSEDQEVVDKVWMKLQKSAKDSAVLLLENLNDYNDFYSWYDTEKWGKVIESHWEAGLEELESTINSKLTEDKAFVPLLIRGGNNVGKSMFAKALINGILTKSPEEWSVVLLDIDLGQPIFGIPCWVSWTEIRKPILSNYEIRIPLNNAEENDIGWVMKSYLINEISPERQEEYYVGTEYQGTIGSFNQQTSFNGIVGLLFNQIKAYYNDQKVVVVINSGGWTAEVKNVINFELKGIKYDDKNQIEGNLTEEAQAVLWRYKNFKGRTRRNKLLELNTLDLHPSSPFYKENCNISDKVIKEKYATILPEILYYTKKDVYSLIKLQTQHSYSFDEVYLSADMTEYLFSNSDMANHLAEMFHNRIVAVWKISNDDISKIETPEITKM